MTAMRVKLALAAAITVAAAGLFLHAATAQDDAPGWAKPALCLACHKALSKELVARFEETKHSKAEPKDEMSPADIARRSLGFNPQDGSYVAAGIGCQACHGPGAAHVSSKAEDKKATMIKLDELKTPNQKLSVCGRCHGQYTVGGQAFVGDFKPGDDLLALEGFQLAAAAAGGPFSKLNEFMASEHKDNDITCITCHTSHEETPADPLLRKKLPDLCLDCHETKNPCKVSPDEYPEGATCATCHMPDRKHTFAVQK